MKSFWLYFKFSLFIFGFALAIAWLTLSYMNFEVTRAEAFQRAGVIAQVSALIMFSAAFAGFPSNEGDLQMLQDHFNRIGPEGINALFDQYSDQYGDDKKHNEKIIRWLERGGGPKPILLGIKSTALFFEIAILILGTLQTGYGDWLLCSLQEGGISKCNV